MRYLWGVRRYDVGDEPVVMKMESGDEGNARDWHLGMMNAHRRWCENHPDEEPPHEPELVQVALDWQVVE